MYRYFFISVKALFFHLTKRITIHLIFFVVAQLAYS